METGIWPDDTSIPQMDDWLAELRGEGDDAEPPAGRHARLASEHSRGPDAHAAGEADTRATPVVAATARAEVRADDHDVRAEDGARAEAGVRVSITERAVIGDELRMPIVWCEMGSCIARHTDPAALGEADIHARAIAAGWRVDALGRLACPGCQQRDGGFRTTHPVRMRGHGRPSTRASVMQATGREAPGAGSGASADVIPPAAPALVPLPAREPQWESVSRSGHAR